MILRTALIVLLGCALAVFAAPARLNDALVKPATPKSNNRLFGGFYWIHEDEDGGGYPEDWMQTEVNYLVFCFINPANLTFPTEFIEELRAFKRSGRTILISIGGEAYGDDWSWLASSEDTVAAAQTVGSWVAQYGIDGVDIDYEADGNPYSPDNMVVFMEQLRKIDSNMIITLDVYGAPEGRDFHNYLINNHLNGSPRLINWIHIMAYASYDLSVQYIENYTKAPRSKYDHPIDAAVDPQNVMIGLMGTGGYPGCDPSDYTQMAAYINQNNLLGAAIWGFVNVNSTLQLPWFRYNCSVGYYNLCENLLPSQGWSCGSAPPSPPPPPTPPPTPAPGPASCDGRDTGDYCYGTNFITCPGPYIMDCPPGTACVQTSDTAIACEASYKLY